MQRTQGINISHEAKPAENQAYDWISPDGTYYTEYQMLGMGVNVIAYKSISLSNKKIAILKSKDNKEHVTLTEVYKKIEFLTALYPEKANDFHLILREDGTYRLIAPIIPGKGLNNKSFEEFPLTDTESQIHLFLAVIEALEACHNKGYIFLDLKTDNIHYRASDMKCYLIDGGMSEKEHSQFSYPGHITSLQSEAEVQQRRKEFKQHAPEMFTTNEFSIATRKMDIYSLGVMLKGVLKNYGCSQINELITACMKFNPEERPNLSDLKEKLKDLEHQFTGEKVALLAMQAQKENNKKEPNKNKWKNKAFEKASTRIINRITTLRNEFETNYNHIRNKTKINSLEEMADAHKCHSLIKHYEKINTQLADSLNKITQEKKLTNNNPPLYKAIQETFPENQKVFYNKRSIVKGEIINLRSRIEHEIGQEEKNELTGLHTEEDNFKNKNYQDVNSRMLEVIKLQLLESLNLKKILTHNNYSKKSQAGIADPKIQLATNYLTDITNAPNLQALIDAINAPLTDPQNPNSLAKYTGRWGIFGRSTSAHYISCLQKELTAIINYYHKLIKQEEKNGHLKMTIG